MVSNVHTKLYTFFSNRHLLKLTNKFGYEVWEMRNVLRKCTLLTLFRSFVGPSYTYPTAPPLTKLPLKIDYRFSLFNVGKFGPVYAKNTLDRNSHELHKVWVTLYIMLYCVQPRLP